MKPITQRRGAWLRIVHRLHCDLRRPPSSFEVGPATGTTRKNSSRVAITAERDGHLIRGPRASVMGAAPLRVTPAALVQLGVPMVVYLAWPMTSSPDVGARGRAAARWLASLGVYAVSPFLTGDLECTASMHAAALLAQRADAVVVMSDPLLIGRPDVSAALLARAPVGVVTHGDEEQISTAPDLWIPPRLVPPLAE